LHFDSEHDVSFLCTGNKHFSSFASFEYAPEELSQNVN
jgi:hypothetical protein